MRIFFIFFTCIFFVVSVNAQTQKNLIEGIWRAVKAEYTENGKVIENTESKNKVLPLVVFDDKEYKLIDGDSIFNHPYTLKSGRLSLESKTIHYKIDTLTKDRLVFTEIPTKYKKYVMRCTFIKAENIEEALKNQKEDFLKRTAKLLSQKKVEDKDTVEFIPAAFPAQFPGGQKEYVSFLTTNLVYPKKALYEGVVSGKVFVSFVIEKDGEITAIKAIKFDRDDFRDEAIRVLDLMPKWVPGKNAGGEPVREKKVLCVQFRTE